jgi:8-oxo-dGTP pyrophosphatase MutT (NUDIX family)
MQRIGSQTVYEGPIASVRIDEFRHADGSTVTRQVVSHPGAVVMVPHDGQTLYLVRQPREAAGEESLLELPAGKLDVPGEEPIDCARRELREEIGKQAEEWRELKRFYTSPGFTEEEIIVYLATAIREAEHEPDPEERIEIVEWPLADLDGAIAECRDAKSLVALFLLRDELGR